MSESGVTDNHERGGRRRARTEVRLVAVGIRALPIAPGLAVFRGADRPMFEDRPRR